MYSLNPTTTAETLLSPFLRCKHAYWIRWNHFSENIWEGNGISIVLTFPHDQYHLEEVQSIVQYIVNQAPETNLPDACPIWPRETKSTGKTMLFNSSIFLRSPTLEKKRLKALLTFFLTARNGNAPWSYLCVLETRWRHKW